MATLPMDRIFCSGAAVAAALLILAAGCATGPEPIADPFGGVPQDFAVDVTVLAGPAWSRPRTPRGAHTRPGRYVLLGDGSLYWGPETGGLPPRRRVLDRRQVHDVWLLALELGLADPTHAEPAINPRLVSAGPEELVYVAVFTADVERWAYERRADRGEPPDQVMARFVGRLADLAWVGRPEVEEPRTENFGPDPYARYRR